MKNVTIFVSWLIAAWVLNACSYNQNVINSENNKISASKSSAAKVSINSGWKFKKLLSNENDENNHLVSFNDDTWNDVRLPHTANIEPLVVNNQWQGISWYRRHLDVPKELDGKKVFLEFEAAMNHSKIWINNQLVSDHHGGYLPVVIDATDYVLPGKENIVAVRLDNTDNEITGPKPLKILDFNMYGGLYRNAWMTVKEKVYISNANLANKVAGGGVFITTPKVDTAESHVQIKTHVVNDISSNKQVVVNNAVYDKGVLISQQSSPLQTINANSDAEFVSLVKVKNAKLWSPKSPYLYDVVTTVFIDDKKVDEQKTRVGIRHFELKNQELFINGEKTYLRGVNRHQDYPFIGYALSDNAQYRDAKKIKEGGFDYIRLSHYPQSPAFLDACDELGIVVLDAILGWQFYADTDQFRNYTYKSAKELIRRDRNHASVLAWEVSLNETKMPIFYMEELNRIVHTEFPGENVYSAGWMNEVYDIYLQARQHRILHKSDHDPVKPYSVSEYGDWEYYSRNAGLNQDKMPKDMRLATSSRQLRAYGEKRLLQQVKNLQESHNDNFNTKAFSDSYWVMYDYNRGYHDGIESSGVMDIFRLPKFGYYFYQSQQSPEIKPVIKIASYWNEKSSLDIKVLSNVEEVHLFLNDKLIAKQTPDNGKNTENLGHPPFTFALNKYEAGTLKAIGFINGKAVTQDVVKTPGKAVALKVWLDESGKKPAAGHNDVLFAYIAVVDANGTVLPNITEEIDFTLNGDVKLLNPSAVVTEAGIATALLQIGDKAGNVTLHAKQDELEGRLTFTSK
ncbi:glycoside hydrolase family 2 TIM barrel-domain containing protein [Pseudocolwellia agarivorans]|uniref:glycoside hydrolase family 2 TIM barrel-domain containing protein n=1 Tax=Pseudocolwellia agarivorans TaxID=1911682 RepID=UPI0009858441|nr:glycoside hydrolase family 2 TIM barrel-domain containing protein [Pseudocolwellia agarivorans]